MAEHRSRGEELDNVTQKQWNFDAYKNYCFWRETRGGHTWQHWFYLICGSTLEALAVYRSHYNNRGFVMTYTLLWKATDW